MSLQARRVLGRFIAFGLLGLLFEVFFGAAWNLRLGNLEMHGRSSPWMMLDYGLLGVLLMPIARPLIRRKIPLVLRALVYMVAIFAVEFVSGWLFDLAGLDIWDNSALPFNLCGYIALMYVPVWYAVGLVAEYVYRKVDLIVLLLLWGPTTEELRAQVR